MIVYTQNVIIAYNTEVQTASSFLKTTARHWRVCIMKNLIEQKYTTWNRNILSDFSGFFD